MHLHPVIDQVIRSHPVDPLLALAYLAGLLGSAIAGFRRPLYGVAALVVVQPFSLYSDVFHTTITLSKVVMVGLALGMMCRPESFAFLRERTAKPFILAGLTVAIATGITLVIASHRAPVLRETAKALEYVALFVIVYCAYRAQQDARFIRFIITCTILVVVVGALSQEILGAPSGLYIHNHPIPRIAGPLEGPNQLAGFLDISVALLLAFELDRPGALALITLTLAMAADVLTFSRGGYIGVAVSVVAVLLAYRRASRLALLGIGAGIAAGAAVIGGWEVFAREAPTVGGYASSGATLFRIEGISEASYAGGVGSRSQLWHAAFRLWRSHPLLGVGAGNYELDLSQAGLKGIRTHSNSLYVQAAVEGGIPLFAATIWLVYTSIATLYRRIPGPALVVGALGGSAGLAVHQIGDLLTFYPKVGGWWWVVLALGAAEAARGSLIARGAVPKSARETHTPF